MYDIIIKNGTLFKGDNQLAQKNDLKIKDGRIVFIGDLKNEKAKTEINAESKFVAPGFIDIHNDADHSLNLLFSSSAENLLHVSPSKPPFKFNSPRSPLPPSCSHMRILASMRNSSRLRGPRKRIPSSRRGHR